MDPSDRWACVLAHRERLLALARAHTAVPDDAEDIVQEALLRSATFDDLDLERLGQFLTAVTLRLCVDEHRRRERAARLARRLPVDPDAPGADENVCAQAEAQWAAGLVDELPASQQVVIAARADGLSYDEISRRHRMTFKSVESAVSRARSTVRRALAATLGLAVAARRQVEQPAFASVSVAVAVAITVAGGPGPGRDGLRPAPRHEATAPAVVRLPVGPVARDVPVAPRTAATRPALHAPVARPRPTSPTPTPDRIPVGPYSVGPDERNDDYSPVERIEHCVEYGVTLGPPIGCRYPDDPR